MSTRRQPPQLPVTGSTGGGVGVPQRRLSATALTSHAVLRRRAAAAHQSLQEYLRARLINEAATATVEEALARIETRRGGTLTLGAAAAAVRADRDSR